MCCVSEEWIRLIREHVAVYQLLLEEVAHTGELGGIYGTACGTAFDARALREQIEEIDLLLGAVQP